LSIARRHWVHDFRQNEAVSWVNHQGHRGTQKQPSGTALYAFVSAAHNEEIDS
jgi:hypothetical protein